MWITKGAALIRGNTALLNLQVSPHLTLYINPFHSLTLFLYPPPPPPQKKKKKHRETRCFLCFQGVYKNSSGVKLAKDCQVTSRT